VWFVNSARGRSRWPPRLAIADLTSVQHGFWVVLGALSVLRTNASATGSTALRALLGTVIGFAVGGLLIVAIGTSHPALWVALPIAIMVASYARHGPVRRRAGGVHRGGGGAVQPARPGGLADRRAAHRGRRHRLRGQRRGRHALLAARGGGRRGQRPGRRVPRRRTYLAQAVRWALGLQHEAPQPAAAVTAAVRLDDALRGFLASRAPSGCPSRTCGGWSSAPPGCGSPRTRWPGYRIRTRAATESAASWAIGPTSWAGWYDRLAAHVGPHTNGTRAPLELPTIERVTTDAPTSYLSCTLWVDEHLQHITPHLAELIEPAEAVAATRAIPWWR